MQKPDPRLLNISLFLLAMAISICYQFCSKNLQERFNEDPLPGKGLQEYPRHVVVIDEGVIFEGNCRVQKMDRKKR
jgi:hypothetical protein